MGGSCCFFIFFMKKTIFILLLTIGLNSKSQELFNNNYINNDGSGNWISSTMIYKNNNFYLNGGYSVLLEDCQSYWSRGMFLLSIDSIGNMTNKKHYSSCEKKIYEGNFNSLIYVGNSLYSCGVIYHLSASISSIFLTNLTQELDTLCFIEVIVDTTSKRAYSLCSTYDNNIVICGQIDSTNNEMTGQPDTVHAKASLIKADYNGNILWQKSYSFEDESDGCWSLFKKVIPTYDKGFIAIGVFHINHTAKNIIIKTDSVGNKEWAGIFGSSNYDNPSFTDVIETKDSCYIICGAYAYGESYGGYYPYDAYILKYDIEGNQIWSKKHRDSITSGNSSNEYYGYYSGITENDNGDLFTILQTRSDEYGQFIGVKFRIRCLDSYGNRKWDKVIDSVGNQLGALFPHSIVLTTDEYIVVGGWGEIYYMDSTEDWTSAQRIFLLKTDTSHIDIPTNNIIQHNPKPITNFALTCYPNPASNETYIEIPKEIKEDILIVYSTNGQIVLEQNIIYGENKINLYDFKPGMYLLRLKNNNLYGKLLVK